jgi:hypothetical protein
MKIPSPGILLIAFAQVWRRFPGAMLCTLLGTIACFALIDYNEPGAGEDFFARNWITCQLGLPFLTALVAFSESNGWNEKRGWLLQGAGFIGLIACWFWLDTKATDFDWRILPQYLALVLVMHLCVAFGPYLNDRSVRDFWEYNRQLFANFIVGSAFTLILFVGLALAILAVDNLFGLDFQERLYAKLFVLLAGLFNTSYFLFHFPKKYAAEADASANIAGGDPAAYSWVFRNLSKFILIPIVILYFLILYAYAAKIGLQWSLPHGWIGSLVIGFSVAGIFTYLLNFYLAEEEDNPMVRGFKRWFWWVLLPLAGLLSIAIGRRISDYGVTEPRYLVALLGGWLAAACLYFLISKNDNIKFIPISLAIVALVWAFGPLSAFSVSERSQKGVLTEILTKGGRFENGKMKPGSIPLTEPELARISSAISFLENHDALSALLPEPIDSNVLEYNGLVKWLRIDPISANETNTLNIVALETPEPMDLRGYDTAYRVRLHVTNQDEPDAPGYFFCLSKDGKMLEWWQKKEDKRNLIEQFSFAPGIQKWSEYHNQKESYQYLEVSEKERIINFSGKKGSLRIIIEEAQIEMLGQDKRLEYCYGLLLLKEK